MNTIRNIGLSLVGHIESSNKIPIDKIKKTLDEYNKERQESDEFVEKQKNIYISLYENPRIQNDIEYNAYIQRKQELYDSWKPTKSKSHLVAFLKLPFPKYEIVPEVYTYTMINPNKLETKNNINKPEQNHDNIKKVVKKEKECPEGKILNPKTGRCINDPNYKKQ